MSSAPRQRPKYYELNLTHHWAPAVLSIFHRLSGLVLFFPVLPALLWIMDSMLASEQGYAQWREVFSHPLAKIAMLGVIWLYAHHFWAGLRYLALDMHWGVAKAPARASAMAVFVLGVLTTLLVGWRTW
jgi:succinate dehydrogenase / fumarate reductase, cytochrome b subunit